MSLCTWTRLLQCAGCGKVIHVQVLYHSLLLQLKVQTFIYLKDKSPWYHSLTDGHSNLYATSGRGRGALHSPCTIVNWCTYLSWRIWSGCKEIPILVVAAVSMWEVVDDAVRTAHPCSCTGNTVTYIYVEVLFSWQPSFILAMQGWPLGGVSGALAPGADFEGALKRWSPPGHTLIRSTVAWRRRSWYNWKYAWLAQITLQLCLCSVVDASWSRCVANFYLALLPLHADQSSNISLTLLH
jgi:hypothetical protein